jgi:hypothetical protein
VIEINGLWYTVGQLSSGISPAVVNTGQQMSLTLNLYDAKGAQDITHVGLYTDFPQKIDNPAYAMAAVAYDTSGNGIINTDGSISGYSIKTSSANNVLTVTFNINFAKPLGTQDLVLRFWNAFGASQDMIIAHALNIVGTSTTPSTAQPSTTPSTAQPSTTPSTALNNANLMTVVKEWAGYSPISISDSQLLQAVGYEGNHIPTWVMRNVAKYLVDSDISKNDFTSVIKYLEDRHIIK